jgi:hypothetical protein
MTPLITNHKQVQRICVDLQISRKILESVKNVVTERYDTKEIISSLTVDQFT